MMEKLRQSEEKAAPIREAGAGGLLAARVAHDVRNPLSSIKMRAQLLESRLKPGADGVDLVQAILRRPIASRAW